MSKNFNRERSNGIAQGREDSRWMRERIAELEAENDELRGELGLGDGEMTYRQKANSYREELNERCLQVGKLQIERRELEAAQRDLAKSLSRLLWLREDDQHGQTPVASEYEWDEAWEAASETLAKIDKEKAK